MVMLVVDESEYWKIQTRDNIYIRITYGEDQ